MTLVGEPVVLPRSETEKIWVSVSEFRGFAGLDIRIYYNAGEVDWRPTKKGVRISLELKDQLIAAIEKVVAQYETAKESGDVGEAKD
ncbi:MAG: transcriptional coactivator p15/PC4 family protein [Promethearchaeota archaeon]